MKEITLFSGEKTKVDDSDFEILSKLRWFVVKKQYKRYAKCYHGGKQVYMHRMILKEDYIDHKDGDGLNNQRANLRKCNKSQNMANRGLQINNVHGYKGVSWKGSGRTKPWMARIKVDNKQITLGVHKTKKEAAMAYNDAALKYFGEFAYLNKIND